MGAQTKAAKYPAAPSKLDMWTAAATSEPATAPAAAPTASPTTPTSSATRKVVIQCPRMDPRRTAGRSVAVADQRQRGAMDAAAVLLGLRVVERHHLDAVVGEAGGGALSVVDGQEHLAGPDGQAVHHPQVVGVVHLDPPDLQLPERVEEPVRRPLQVDQRQAVVHHHDLAVDVEGVAGQ